MKKILEYINLSMLTTYFFLYMAVQVIKKIIKFICWWTIVPIFCLGLLIVDKVKRWRVRVYGY